MSEKEKTQGKCGLLAIGVQDMYSGRGFDYMYDMRDKFLKDEMHQVLYRKIYTEKESRYKLDKYKLNGIGLYIDRKQCHAINCLDLIIDNPEMKPISEFITSISVSYGPCRIDGHDSYDRLFDIDTHIETTAALFGRKISHIQGKTFIPLCFAPLNPQNLVPIGLEHHELRLEIRTPQTEEGNALFTNPIEIYGNAYFFTEGVKAAFNVTGEMMIFQNNYLNDKMKFGENRIPLGFVHPLYCMYFWGFDKTKVKRVQLVLDGNIYYDGTIEALERKKEMLGYGHLKPVMMFFTDTKVGSRSMSSLNFSRVEKVELVIDTEQQQGCDIWIIALNTQPARYMSGMFGMAYSG